MLLLIIIPLIKQSHSYSGLVTPVGRTTRVLYVVALQGHREVAHEKTGMMHLGIATVGWGILVSYSVTQMSFVYFLASSLPLEVITSLIKLLPSSHPRQGSENAI